MPPGCPQGPASPFYCRKYLAIAIAIARASPLIEQENGRFVLQLPKKKEKRKTPLGVSRSGGSGGGVWFRVLGGVGDLWVKMGNFLKNVEEEKPLES